jgi:MFS family permease
MSQEVSEPSLADEDCENSTEALLSNGSKRTRSDEQQQQLKQKRALVLLSCLAAFSVNSLISAVSPFFPQYAAKHLTTHEELTGVAIAVFPAVSVLSSPFVGWACSRFSRGWVALTGSVCLAAGTLSFGLATTMPLCILARAVQGVGASGVNISTTALLMQGAGSDFTRALATQELFIGFGYIVGPALGGALFSLGGFLATFAVLSALPALFAVALPALLRSAGVPLSSWSDNFDTDDASGEDDAEASAAWCAAMKRILLIASALACCTCSLLYSSAFGFLDVAFEKHLESALGTPPFLTGLMCSMPSLTYCLGCGAIASLTERFGFQRCMVTGLSLMAFSMWLLAPLPWVLRPLFTAR